MNEKEIEIMKKYKAFIHPEKSIQQSLMAFGFECDEGWYLILKNLFEAISKLNPPSDFEIFQVKEKFGGLRVYTNSSTKEIEALIDKAEEESFNTCEVCGASAKPSTRGGWVKTICENCLKEI